MKTAIISSLVFVAAAFIPASATIINIPDDYPTIQEGIDASTDGDSVLVQPGMYVENINFNGHNIVLGSLFLTTGDTSFVSQTIIDGNYSGPVVVFESGEDSTALITGFTIQHGTEGTDVYGGVSCSNSSPTISSNAICFNSPIGIYCNLSQSTITNNIVSQNSGSVGIYCSGSSVTISYNIIVDNSGWAGGIFCGASDNIRISNNMIMDNTTGDSYWGYGGGIAIDLMSDDFIIVDNIISHNYAGWGGGISIMFYSLGYIINNTIIHNSASVGEVGGIAVDESYVYIINSTIAHNSDGGIESSSNGSVHIINSIVWSNTGYSLEGGNFHVAYSDIEGGYSGEGNIDVDPLFRDPDNDDFHLMSTQCSDAFDSPCIDVGSPFIGDSLLDCSWGLGTIRSDMGAYGGGIDLGGCNYIIGDANGDRTANGMDVVYIVNYLKGGSAPPDSCDCPPHGNLLVAADANGSYSVNGLDVTYMVSYYKGGPALLYCEDCPSGIPQGG